MSDRGKVSEDLGIFSVKSAFVNRAGITRGK